MLQVHFMNQLMLANRPHDLCLPPTERPRAATEPKRLEQVTPLLFCPEADKVVPIAERLPRPAVVLVARFTVSCVSNN